MWWILPALILGVDGQNAPTVTALSGEQPSGWLLAAGSEFEAGSFLATPTSSLRPLATLQWKDTFSLKLAPRFRFQWLEQSFRFRTQDYTLATNAGHVVEQLQLGEPEGVFSLRVGNLPRLSLSSGALLARYEPRMNVLLTPASGKASVRIGATETTVLASDVLSASLFAAEVDLDIGRAATEQAAWHNRLHVTPSVLVDFRSACREDCVNTPLALGALDASATAYRGPAFNVTVHAGAAARALSSSVSGGAHAGLSSDVFLSQDTLSLRADFRSQGDRFRFGLVGPQYELARFSDTGFSLTPLAAVRYANSTSVFIEAQAQLRRTVSLGLAVEAFSFGRTDIDGDVTLRLLEEKLLVSLQASVVSVSQTPRLTVSSSVSWRLMPGVYVIGAGGTQFINAAQGGLARAVQVSLGLGVDVERAF
jgi:hypothetical protein